MTIDDALPVAFVATAPESTGYAWTMVVDLIDSADSAEEWGRRRFTT